MKARNPPLRSAARQSRLAENGQVKAAISVTTPKFRYTDEKKQQITQLLLKKRQLIEESCRIQNCRLVF